MPELPEVETMVQDLRRRIVGRVLTGVEMPFAGSVRWPSPEEFAARVRGRRLERIERRGKYASLILSSGDALIVHRGMSGSLLLRQPDAPLETHVRVLFRLDDGAELRFNDPRKFGKIYVMDAQGAERPLPWHHMGPEPLEPLFAPEVFASNLAKRSAQIKPLLLNQQIVAGLGNIYVDEALHRAKIHPVRPANSLTDTEVQNLHAGIQHVLAEAVRGRGTTFSSYTDIEGREGQFQASLHVFHREGQACPTCGTEIIKRVVGGRGTHICPTCQQEP